MIGCKCPGSSHHKCHKSETQNHGRPNPLPPYHLGCSGLFHLDNKYLKHIISMTEVVVIFFLTFLYLYVKYSLDTIILCYFLYEIQYSIVFFF